MTQREYEVNRPVFEYEIERQPEREPAPESDLERLLDKPVGTTSDSFQKLVAAKPKPRPAMYKCQTCSRTSSNASALCNPVEVAIETDDAS